MFRQNRSDSSDQKWIHRCARRTGAVPRSFWLVGPPSLLEADVILAVQLRAHVVEVHGEHLLVPALEDPVRVLEVEEVRGREDLS